MPETVADGVERDIPKPLLEPARRVGVKLAALAAAAGGVLAAAQPLTDLAPGQYHAQVSAAIGIGTAAVAGATWLAAKLIRGKVVPYEVYRARVEEILAGKQANP